MGAGLTDSAVFAGFAGALVERDAPYSSLLRRVTASKCPFFSSRVAFFLGASVASPMFETPTRPRCRAFHDSLVLHAARRPLRYWTPESSLWSCDSFVRVSQRDGIVVKETLPSLLIVMA